MKHYVEIVEYDTGEVVQRLKANSERQAEKLDRDLNINLNHDQFFTRIVVENSESKP
jgi:hypothetical protein